MKKIQCKRWLGHCYQLVTPTADSRRVILIYHSVDGGPWSTPLSSFKEQMAWLSKHATVVPLATMLDHSTAISGLQVALTFDDGYQTLHDVVSPLLNQYKFPATVYLNSAFIGDGDRLRSDAELGLYPEESFLTWSEVRSLRDQNWTIGSHGLQHLDLTVEEIAVVAEQSIESKRVIAERLQQACEHFSYTWGRHNPMVRQSIAKAGYKSAVAGQHTAVTSHEDRLMLPRLDVCKEYRLDDLVSVVKGDWDYLQYISQIKRFMVK
jgi:peptidoglycan/xylan/chitin deacetylase (PgdA/CDA1 family)